MPEPALDLSIVIPLYNEEDNVKPLYDALKTALEPLGRTYEVIIVDDGSRDGSFAELQRVAEADPQVKVVRFRRNFGQTAGFSAGFDHASGDIIITMDADLQNDPQDIARLLEAMSESDSDVVSGRRMDRKEAFLTRKLPSQLANGLISRVTGVQLHDYGCSLKAYRRHVVKNIRLYGELHRYIPAIASMVGAKVTELPVQDHPRIHGKSKYGLSRTLRVVLDLMAVHFLLRYRDRPMQLFGRIGLAAFGLGSLLDLAFLLSWLALGNAASVAWLIICGGLLNVGGAQIICMGLLADLLMRTYFEAQGKPVYLVRETLGFAQDPS